MSGITNNNQLPPFPPMQKPVDLSGQTSWIKLGFGLFKEKIEPKEVPREEASSGKEADSQETAPHKSYKGYGYGYGVPEGIEAKLAKQRAKIKE